MTGLIYRDTSRNAFLSRHRTLTRGRYTPQRCITTTRNREHYKANCHFFSLWPLRASRSLDHDAPGGESPAYLRWSGEHTARPHAIKVAKPHRLDFMVVIQPVVWISHRLNHRLQSGSPRRQAPPVAMSRSPSPSRGRRVSLTR
jgi:hypothetical protein